MQKLSKIVITIDRLHNDAFFPEAEKEIHRILDKASTMIKYGTQPSKLLDFNGNEVGRIEYTYDIFSEYDQSYYFTFGTDKSFPYRGGWVEVIAMDNQSAVDLFIEKYPLNNGMLNCCSVYSALEFKRTEMFKYDDNLGAGLHEIIRRTEVR